MRNTQIVILDAIVVGFGINTGVADIPFSGREKKFLPVFELVPVVYCFLKIALLS